MTDVVGTGVSAEPIRLLYLRDTLTVCGPGKTALSTWRTIDKARFDLTIVATKPSAGSRNVFLDEAHRMGAKTIDLTIGRGVDLVAVWRLIRLLREQRIDILQTHDAQTRRIGVLAAMATGTCHVTSVHGWIFNDRKEQAAKWVDARLIRRADAVIAVSDRLRQELQAAGVPASRISLLRNSILLDDYAARNDGTALRRELGILNGHPVVSIVGRLSPEKGHEVFLQAALRIRQELPDARFLIVGDGPLETALVQRAEELGLTSSVIFTGHRRDLSAIYGITDVLVISSFTEGIPNVLLEAFAYGKPAVSTAVGGVPEVLEDGENGWLVSPGDSETIAERVLMLLRSNEMRQRMGTAARRTIERHFDFTHRTRTLEELYLRLRATRATRVQMVKAVALTRAAAGAAFRMSRDTVDRALHHRRRHQAIARLVRLTPRSVLMVCFGNICRSPYAAVALAKALVERDTVVDSAGFIGPNRPSPREAQAAAAELGIDLAPHCSKLLTPELLRAHDLIVVMEPSQRRTLVAEHGVPAEHVLVLGDLDVEPISCRAIPDPYGGTQEVFSRCYRRIQRCVDSLATTIAGAPIERAAGLPQIHPCHR